MALKVECTEKLAQVLDTNERFKDIKGFYVQLW